MTSSHSIADMMTANPTTIDRTQPISEAYELLKHAPFHHLVVTDADQPVGMLAASDILRLVYDAEGSDDQALKIYIDHQFTIDDAMSVDLQTLPDSATVHDAANLFAEGAFHSILVLDDDLGLAGIATTTDLARYVRDYH